jgi:7-carboxy-7-deazaguanine synthase
MEHFLTLQGEGLYAGKSAYFIRLAGCDVGCVWCDVKESWEADKHPVFSLQKIKELLEATPAEIVVITGGEPTLYNLTPIVDLIHSLGKRAHIETAGTNAIQGNFDWVTFSPKKFKQPVSTIFECVNELKVVVFHKSDIEWAQQWATKLPKTAKLYLQAEWSKKETISPLLINFILNNPNWTLSVQTHKYLNIP